MGTLASFSSSRALRLWFPSGCFPTALLCLSPSYPLGLSLSMVSSSPDLVHYLVTLFISFLVLITSLINSHLCILSVWLLECWDLVFSPLCHSPRAADTDSVQQLVLTHIWGVGHLPGETFFISRLVLIPSSVLVTKHHLCSGTVLAKKQ